DGGPFRWPAAGHVSLAAGSVEAALCGNDEHLLHGRKPDQGSAVAADRQACFFRLDIDGHLPLGHSIRYLAGLEDAAAAGPATTLSRVLRPARGHRGQAAVGWRSRLFAVR